MRSLLLALGGAILLAGGTPSPSEAASCAKGRRIVERNGTITLYMAPRGLFACAGTVRRRLEPWARDFFGDPRVPTFVSQGFFVGVDRVSSGHCADFFVLAVDVRTGRRWELPAGTGSRESLANGCVGTGTGRLQAIAGAGRTVAWISGPGPGPAAPASDQPYASYEVMLKQPGVPPRSIAYAEHIDPRVLRIDATALTWRQDGAERAVALSG